MNHPSFNIENFWKFCAALRVDTKELGEVTLSKETLLGTQIYFIEEIVRGINEGCHSFVCLKGRQLGITTICLALDLYWLFKHKGLNGSMVTHDEPTRDDMRSTLSMYMEGLPNQWKVPEEIHNRTQLVLKNRSKLSYQVAGTRKNTKLGKGKALIFLHATECSEYGDEEGMASLEASLAQENPNRLFIYETTAQGYNAFYDMWKDAKASIAKRAIFIGWWRNQFYRKSKDSQEYKTYWDGKLTPEERKWVNEVKKIYGFEIDDEQMAWWRWCLNEVQRDETLMYQNYPPTENYAFIKTGTNFFNITRINDEIKAAKSLSPKNFRFVLRQNFEESELVECGEKLANLKVWDNPVAGGHYVIGADPAYGSSEWADRFCASIFRCYSDGMEQVAEFNTTDCTTYQFAWVICHLAGAYSMNKGSSCMLNLEINGPGQAVWMEMQNLKRVAANSRSADARGILNVVSNIQNFMYKRPDSFGAPSAYHTITSNREKERMFNCFKDGFERGMIKVKSADCIDEMNNVERNNGYLGAPGRGKDDRVVAAALATISWVDFVRIRLVQMGLSKSESASKDVNGNSGAVNAVTTYLKKIGVSRK